jgi:hypothetical protein
MTRHLNLNLQIKFQISHRNQHFHQIIFIKIQIQNVFHQYKIEIINH